MVLGQKKIVPLVEELKYLVVLFTSEGKMKHEKVRRIIVVCRDAVEAPICCGEEETEPKGKALGLLVDLPSHCHLCSKSLHNDLKYSRNIWPKCVWCGWAFP